MTDLATDDLTDGATDQSADEASGETLAVPMADLRPALEAILMVADEPLDRVRLASVVGYPVAEVDDALSSLASEYTEQGRGFELREVAGGWRYYTREEFSGVVEGFVLDGQQARLTQAALETLAVVAYKQPVSRARVSAIRGVNVDGVMRTLLNRGLVEEAAIEQETGAHLYRTSGYFLERIGITSLDELPELAPLLPEMADLDAEEYSDARAASDVQDRSDTGGSDTGGSDTGGSDTGGSDTGGSDTGGSDTGGSDTGGSDTGGSDTGGSDTGGSDTGGWDDADTEPSVPGTAP